MTGTSSKTGWMMLLAGLLITANIVSLVLLWTAKQSAAAPDHQRGGRLFDYLSTELNFSAEQRASYAVLRDEHQRGMRQLLDSIRDRKDSFFALLKQKDAAAEILQKSAAEIAALNERLDLFTFAHFQKVRALGTPEQQQKFDHIISDALRVEGKNLHHPPPHP